MTGLGWPRLPRLLLGFGASGWRTHGFHGPGWGWLPPYLQPGRRHVLVWPPYLSLPRPPVVLPCRDECCNPTLLVSVWPLGTVVLWWHPGWRSDPCARCRARAVRAGMCAWCQAHPCAGLFPGCADYRPRPQLRVVQA